MFPGFWREAYEKTTAEVNHVFETPMCYMFQAVWQGYENSTADSRFTKGLPTTARRVTCIEQTKCSFE